MTKTDFLSLATAAALKSSRVSGLPPGVTVAQAALESAWGKSQLAREAHNYFGMKVHGAHPWIELPTTEFRNGARVRVQARFARYASMDECFADRDALIRRGPRYREACACADHPHEFIHALAAHWATDPAYAEKLLATYRANALYELDKTFAAQFRAATQIFSTQA